MTSSIVVTSDKEVSSCAYTIEVRHNVIARNSDLSNVVVFIVL